MRDAGSGDLWQWEWTRACLKKSWLPGFRLGFSATLLPWDVFSSEEDGTLAWAAGIFGECVWRSGFPILVLLARFYKFLAVYHWGSGEGAMLPAHLLNGNVTIETSFYDGNLFVSKSLVRIYYDGDMPGTR